MFTPFDHEDHDLELAISRAHSALSQHEPQTDEYRKINQQLRDLYALRQQIAQLNLQAQQSYAAHQLATEQAANQQRNLEAAHQLACDQNAWQEEQDDRPFWERIDPNTAVTVAGNILIGLAVIHYEQRGVIATKVMSFMRKI